MRCTMWPCQPVSHFTKRPILFDIIQHNSLYTEAFLASSSFDQSSEMSYMYLPVRCLLNVHSLRKIDLGAPSIGRDGLSLRRVFVLGKFRLGSLVFLNGRQARGACILFCVTEKPCSWSSRSVQPTDKRDCVNNVILSRNCQSRWNDVLGMVEMSSQHMKWQGDPVLHRTELY